jgi:hypothetical protein
MDGTILSQGTFRLQLDSAGWVVPVPSGIDWMWVWNSFNAALPGQVSPVAGVEYYWQRGMEPGQAYVKFYSATTGVLNGDFLLSGGFTLFDPSGQDPDALPLVGNTIATTATTNAVRPVVSTANTSGIGVGSVVRLSSTAQTDVNGIDMVVSAVTPGVSFELLFASNALANVPGVVGGAGFYRVINVSELFYPRHRYITDVSQALLSTVSTSIAHGMTAGQLIRFSIPKLATGAQGMVQLDGLTATVLQVVDDYSFITDLNTLSFSPFVWPTVAQQPSSFPLMIPVGENTASALASIEPQVPTVGGVRIPGTQSGILADAAVNTGVLGMFLGAGANGTINGAFIQGPGAASVANSEMFWRVGKSSYIDQLQNIV